MLFLLDVINVLNVEINNEHSNMKMTNELITVFAFLNKTNVVSSRETKAFNISEIVSI